MKLTVILIVIRDRILEKNIEWPGDQRKYRDYQDLQQFLLEN